MAHSLKISEVELQERGFYIEQATATQFLVRELEANEFKSFVAQASGSKCARCWNFMPNVSNYGIWENVCDRCHSALKEMNIAPPQPEAAA